MTKNQVKKFTISEMNKIVSEMAYKKDVSSYRRAYNRFCRINVIFIKDPSIEANDKLVASINELVDEFVKIVN